MNLHLKSLSFLIIVICSFNCNTNSTKEVEEYEYEYEQLLLAWRLVESKMDENYALAEAQFDSLLAFNKGVSPKFIRTGLKVKSELGKEDEVNQILSSQSKETLQVVCENKLFTNFETCLSLPKREVKFPDLQKKLVSMFVCDQKKRDNLMEDIIKKFALSDDAINICDGTDSENQYLLKGIIKKHGFPTLDMVGKDAMDGIWFIIQHADGDLEWQKSQLLNIEAAVKNGDLNGDKYAYLYDRIKVNSGEKQLYGTQFEDVDFDNKTTKLRPTEDIENLDKRRLQIGLSPIELYRKSILKNLR